MIVFRKSVWEVGIVNSLELYFYRIIEAIGVKDN